MNDYFNLKALVQRVMGDIINAHNLSVFELSQFEVVLGADTYLIEIFSDRDGVNILYFDTSHRPILGYNVFLFLLNKRRDSLTFEPNQPLATSREEFVESMLIALAKHLRNAGGDILSGKKDWMNGYHWPTVKPNEELVSFLNRSP